MDCCDEFPHCFLSRVASGTSRDAPADAGAPLLRGELEKKLLLWLSSARLPLVVHRLLATVDADSLTDGPVLVAKKRC
jgi:hypothetical protein